MQPIVIQDLSFSYAQHLKVLNNVSLSIAPGNFIGIIGPNGGGKTTLLKLILGILPSPKGAISIFGHHPSSRKARQNIGYVPQMTSIPKDFPATVLDIITMGFKRWFFSKINNKELDRVCQFLGIQNLLEKSICEISGGQLRRVLLARALLRSPKLLVLDEPIAGVDSSGHVLFFELLQQLKQSGVTILMSSHHVDSLRSHADSIVCLNKEVHFCNNTNLITDELISHTYECELETFFHNRHFHLLKDKCHNHGRGNHETRKD